MERITISQCLFSARTWQVTEEITGILWTHRHSMLGLGALCWVAGGGSGMLTLSITGRSRDCWWSPHLWERNPIFRTQPEAQQWFRKQSPWEELDSFLFRSASEHCHLGDFRLWLQVTEGKTPTVYERIQQFRISSLLGAFGSLMWDYLVCRNNEFSLLVTI